MIGDHDTLFHKSQYHNTSDTQESIPPITTWLPIAYTRSLKAKRRSPYLIVQDRHSLTLLL